MTTPDTTATPLVRRGEVVYETNPFLSQAVSNTKRGVKKIASGNRMMVVAEDTGEVMGGAGFWQTQEVDKTQFMKLYINGVKAFAGLSAAGAKLFAVLYLEMQKKIGQDRVFLSHAMIDKELFPDVSAATYSRGLKDLKEKSFIAPTTTQGWFFVNPDFMWNGDRLAYVKEYRLAGKKPKRKAAAPKAVADQSAS